MKHWDKIPTIMYIVDNESYSAIGIANSMLADETPIMCVIQFKGEGPRYNKTTVGSVRNGVARAWFELEKEFCK